MTEHTKIPVISLEECIEALEYQKSQEMPGSRFYLAFHFAIEALKEKYEREDDRR